MFPSRGRRGGEGGSKRDRRPRGRGGWAGGACALRSIRGRRALLARTSDLPSSWRFRAKRPGATSSDAAGGGSRVGGRAGASLGALFPAEGLCPCCRKGRPRLQARTDEPATTSPVVRPSDAGSGRSVRTGCCRRSATPPCGSSTRPDLADEAEREARGSPRRRAARGRIDHVARPRAGPGAKPIIDLVSVAAHPRTAYVVPLARDAPLRRSSSARRSAGTRAASSAFAAQRRAPVSVKEL